MSDGRGALSDDEVAGLLAGVDEADAEAARAWPGVPATRQPVQVLYVPLDRIRPETTQRYGTAALRLLEAHAPDGASLAAACGLEVDAALADRVHERVVAKLSSEPVERPELSAGVLIVCCTPSRPPIPVIVKPNPS